MYNILFLNRVIHFPQLLPIEQLNFTYVMLGFVFKLQAQQYNIFHAYWQ